MIRPLLYCDLTMKNQKHPKNTGYTAEQINAIEQFNIEVYKDYTIKPKKDFGEYGFLINGKRVRKGFVVVDKHNINIMPGATWFQTIKDAKKGIDVFIEHGVKNFWKGWEI